MRKLISPILGTRQVTVTEVKCPKCGYIWEYHGNNKETLCPMPNCRAFVTLYTLKDWKARSASKNKT